MEFKRTRTSSGPVVFSAAARSKALILLSFMHCFVTHIVWGRGRDGSVLCF